MFRWILVAALLAACLPDARSAAAAPPTAAKLPPAAVTAQEATAFAKSVDAVSMNGDVSALKDALDEDEIFARAVAGLPLRDESRAAMRQHARIVDSLIAQIQPLLAQGGSYRFVRINQRDGQPRPLFRLAGAKQGLNYHELYLHRDAAGKVRVGDMLIFTLGDTLSETLRANFTPMIAKDGAIKITPDQQALVDAGPTLAKARNLLSEGKPAEAQAAYDTLPEVVRARKTVALTGLMISARGGDYDAAVEGYRAKFPQAAEVELVAMETLVARKEYDAALKAVDRLDKRVGGDDFLNHYRGMMAFAKGDKAAARPLLRKAVAAAPWRGPACILLVECELDAGDFDAAAEAMTTATRHAGIEWQGIEDAPPFAEFVKSPAYAKWKAAQAGAAAAPAANAPPVAGAAGKLVLVTAGKSLGLTLGDKQLTLGLDLKETQRRWGKPEKLIPTGPANAPVTQKLCYDKQGFEVVLATPGVVYVQAYLEPTKLGGRDIAASGAVTDKGIRRGSTRAEVIKAYGKPSVNEPGEMQFPLKPDGWLKFLFRDGVLYAVSVQ